MYRRESKSRNCGDKARLLDRYSKPFQFLLPDHRTNFNTFIGSFLTLVTFGTLMTYGTYKFITLVNQSEYSLQEVIERDFFDESHIFSAKDGFKIAATFLDPFNSTTFDLDPSIGAIEFISI